VFARMVQCSVTSVSLTIHTICVIIPVEAVSLQHVWWHAPQVRSFHCTAQVFGSILSHLHHLSVFVLCLLPGIRGGLLFNALYWSNYRLEPSSNLCLLCELLLCRSLPVYRTCSSSIGCTWPGSSKATEIGTDEV